jgi:GTPase SAR1 family protein
VDLIFVTGTAGSGKSLLTSALKEWFVRKSVDAVTVNLDPGVLSMPYSPDLDIRDKIDLQEIMRSYELGPNGALVLASDLIATKVKEIQDELDAASPDYAIVDTPGQVELFAFRESGQYVVHELEADSKVLLFLLDPLLANSPSNFLSILLLDSSIQLRIGIPRISVLTKRDIAPDRVAEILKWAKNSKDFEDSLSKTADGEEYSFYSELYRSIKQQGKGADLYPVSSVTLSGYVALMGEISRIAKGGEETTE